MIGIGFGYLLFRFLDHRAIAIVMAAITLIFVGLWLVAGAEVTIRPRSTPKAITAGLASGITTMVAHSGGPPLAMYLLPLGLSKEVYAGTTSLFFTVGNATKAVPWLLLVKPTGDVWTLMAICLLAIPAGVWLGWRLHGSAGPASDLSGLLRIAGRDGVEIIVGRRFRLSRVSQQDLGYHDASI